MASQFKEDFAFNYYGPRDRCVDPNCDTCTAIFKSKCPNHGTALQSTNCGHCQAIHTQTCQAHRGIAAALEGFVGQYQGSEEVVRAISSSGPSAPVLSRGKQKSLSEDAKEEFEAARAYVLARLAKTQSFMVKVSISYDPHMQGNASVSNGVEVLALE